MKEVDKIKFENHGIVKSLRGIDKTVYNHVINNNLMSAEALEITLREIENTKDSFKDLIIRNGFVKQDAITDIILKNEPKELMDEMFIEPSIPYEILYNHKIMICAVTRKTVFLSTTGSELIAQRELQKYFPLRDFYFIPSNVSKLKNYLGKVKKAINYDDNIIEKIIRDAIRKGASDIHIDPAEKGYTVNLRYLGMLQPIHFGDIAEHNKIVAIIKSKCGIDIAEKRIDQDGQFQIEYNGKKIELRVLSVPSSHKRESVVLRILDPDQVETNLDALGISHVEEWRKGLSNKFGLCIIGGETGSGKTTTLNSSIREIDRFKKKIFTIEDPVEFDIPNVAQITVNYNTGMDFPRAMKSCLRGDPDIIILGEVRDEETARTMIKAAETGHMVVATIHTGHLRGIISRLRDLGINKTELVDILRCVMIQSLVRVPCKSCNGSGCKDCAGVGYIGRTVVNEIVYLGNEKEVKEFLDTDIDLWWETKEEDAYNKYKKGLTTKEELLNVFGESIKSVFEKNGEEF